MEQCLKKNGKDIFYEREGVNYNLNIKLDEQMIV